MTQDVDFPTEVNREFAFLLADRGFSVTSEDVSVVQWRSPTMGFRAVWDPRGEVDVTLFLLELGDPVHGWHYIGAVGRASVPRLLQIAREAMEADPAIVSGNVDYYRRLDAESRRAAREWTAYYERKGPRPKTGQLP